MGLNMTADGRTASKGEQLRRDYCLSATKPPTIPNQRPACQRQ